MGKRYTWRIFNDMIHSLENEQRARTHDVENCRGRFIVIIVIFRVRIIYTCAWCEDRKGKKISTAPTAREWRVKILFCPPRETFYNVTIYHRYRCRCAVLAPQIKPIRNDNCLRCGRPKSDYGFRMRPAKVVRRKRLCGPGCAYGGASKNERFFHGTAQVCRI